MSRDTPEHTLETTERSIELLETIERLNGATVSELASECSLAPSTVYKHLVTLQSNGYLNERENTYYVGFRFLNLGEHARSRIDGLQIIEDAVQELTAKTDEEVDFTVEDHGRVMTILESYHKWVKYGDDGGAERYRARTGSYYHMHATATGKAILASYPRERVDAIVDRWSLPARTEQTITDRTELFAELERIAERGYAIDDQEYADGLRSVGVSVTGPDGGVVGAISVSGPSYRLQGDVLRTTIPEAIRTVRADLQRELVEANTG
ncbi:IclR family transcriptional regulator [Natronococcus sp. A-GB1]|uniref:IclR family transcriptional regulator n=1 Tax=Natronococcus sp. A-GB1 TaxID=3037648 RepID=UPI00241EE49A|nr:IclR family transcriptional regulator [Natronococcus sp. A-GB1]MDG5759892.1 IclR family transcriptional regulator [Natronococcus sp. A-GB1]